jgi:hypothetical protein
MATDERWKHAGVRVIPGTELDPNTPQTPGMDRKAAITFARVGAKKLWAGTVHIHSNAKTGAHHHGPLESVIYVVTGPFGTLVLMGYDWDDKPSWLHSLELFARELLPALNKAVCGSTA